MNKNSEQFTTSYFTGINQDERILLTQEKLSLLIYSANKAFLEKLCDAAPQKESVTAVWNGLFILEIMFGISTDEVIEANYSKLNARYSGGFTPDKSQRRKSGYDGRII